jgi:sialic acid synthase SpsE
MYELPTWVPAIKVGSREAHMASGMVSPLKGGQTVIVSFGNTPIEYAESIRYELEALGHPMIPCACVPEYPTPIKVAIEHLVQISMLKEISGFDDVGWSSHTTGIKDCVMAAHNFGAAYIEKHFRLDGDVNCIDAAVSMTPTQFSRMVRMIRKGEGWK